MVVMVVDVVMRVCVCVMGWSGGKGVYMCMHRSVCCRSSHERY